MPRPYRPRKVGATAPLVFDACQPGVVLRASLYVEIVVATGVMYASPTLQDWVIMFAQLTAAAFPATLLWLLVACSFKQQLACWAESAQLLAGVSLGVLAGLAACLVWSLLAVSEPVPWLAAALTGALLSAGLVFGLQWRAKGRMPADTRARLAHLQSRIRPHFLFNALNSALALVRGDPRRAEQLLEDLAELFRHVLDDEDEYATVADEVALARRYLDIEQIRFGQRLQVHWDLDRRAAGALLPPMALQPLLENAIRHGVEPSNAGAEVTVRTRLHAGIVRLEVSNTVPAGPGRRGLGMALQNVRDRVRLLHDLQGSVRFGYSGDRYQVRIEVPAAPDGAARPGGQ